MIYTLLVITCVCLGLVIALFRALFRAWALIDHHNQINQELRQYGSKIYAEMVIERACKFEAQNAHEMCQVMAKEKTEQVRKLLAQLDLIHE